MAWHQLSILRLYLLTCSYLKTDSRSHCYSCITDIVQQVWCVHLQHAFKLNLNQETIPSRRVAWVLTLSSVQWCSQGQHPKAKVLKIVLENPRGQGMASMTTPLLESPDDEDMIIYGMLVLVKQHSFTWRNIFVWLQFCVLATWHRTDTQPSRRLHIYLAKLLVFSSL